MTDCTFSDKDTVKCNSVGNVAQCLSHVRTSASGLKENDEYVDKVQKSAVAVSYFYIHIA